MAWPFAYFIKSGTLAANRRGLRAVLLDESGVTAVELVFIMTGLLLLSFGVIDFGRMLFDNNAAHKAAQLGAQMAVTRDPIALPLKNHYVCNPPANSSMVGVLCRAADGTLQPECDFGTIVCNSAGCDVNGTAYANGATELSPTVFLDLLAAMQDVFPSLPADAVTITYRPVTLGFIGAPNTVAEVEVEITGVPFDLLALSAFIDFQGLGWTVPTQRVTLTSEDLSDNSCEEQGLEAVDNAGVITCQKKAGGGGGGPKVLPLCF